MDVKTIIADDGVQALLTLALEEDIGAGDRTTDALIDKDMQGVALVVAKEQLVVCGLPVVAAVLALVDDELLFDAKIEEGSRAAEGEILAEIRGSCASLLMAERVVLNILQHLSGIATTTSRIARMVSEYKVAVLDTRKTTPGWRLLEKYAVYVGGGKNHRMGLYDAVLIKNNHIDLIGGNIAGAVEKVRRHYPNGMTLEVEVRNQKELEEALAHAPDAILLDNFTPDELSNAVHFVRQNFIESNAVLEASGGINEKNVVEYAKTGVDAISMGFLTHSARAVDISLRLSKL